MRLARTCLLAVLAIALGSYALDCEAAVTPEQAMQCCHSMQCSRHGHSGMDCCKTMPTMRAPFVQTSSVRGVSFSPVVFAVVPAVGAADGLDSSAGSVAAHCHAPPMVHLPAPRPLRV